jgi:hypothetical protein
VNGAVPPNELGSGTANNAACLHGDSTCGGGGSGGGGGLTAGTLAIKYASDFAWSQNPTADLSTAGAKTVTLTTCPAGVTGTEQQYYVYVSGTGTAEAVLAAGGTCAGKRPARHVAIHNCEMRILPVTTSAAPQADYRKPSSPRALRPRIQREVRNLAK